MTGDQLKGIAEIIQSVVWPSIVLFFLVRFGSSVNGFLDKMTEFSFKAAGLEATAKIQAEVAAALTTAETKTSAASPSPALTEATSAEIAKTVSAVTTKTVRDFANTSVLWVDDHPDNNYNERRALEASGVRVVLSTSTEDGLAKVARVKYDVIVSDLSRGADKQAGIDLLKKLTENGVRVPYIIYSSRGAPTVQETASQLKLPLWGATNRPTELVQMVIAALQNTKP